MAKRVQASFRFDQRRRGCCKDDTTCPHSQAHNARFDRAYTHGTRSLIAPRSPLFDMGR